MTAENITGQRFGKLTVLVRDGTAHGAASWHCRCDCGREVTVMGTSLRTGNTRSCGCLRRERAPVPSGARVGRLTVIRQNGILQNCVAYLCRCDCGEEKTIRGDRLRNHRVWSCGCTRARRAA
jgi:hypothetical protein